jgi:hypothetical protein
LAANAYVAAKAATYKDPSSSIHAHLVNTNVNINVNVNIVSLSAPATIAAAGAPRAEGALRRPLQSESKSRQGVPP